MESRDSKRQRLDTRDNEDGEALDEYKGENEGKDIRYIPFSCIAPLLPPQKESNHPTDMG